MTAFTKGLHDLGNGCFAWLQPDGSWGYSNAGLIVDQGETLLVDTLYDLALTADMLAGFRASVPAAAAIGTLVNTHANADHTFGNQLVSGARIIASRACAEEFGARPPDERIALLKRWQELGDAGRFLHEVYGRRFDFTGVVLTPPTESFDGELTLHVGAKEVRLLEVGPAHTRGDIIVYVPSDRTVFTGDILFVDSHPVIWAGPVSNWIRACRKILSWDVETVVPGHGPVTDKAGVQRFIDYLEWLLREARQRFDAGLSVEEAALDISFGEYRRWLDPERIILNMHTLYREFGSPQRPDLMQCYALMQRYRTDHARTSMHTHPH